MGTLRGLGAVRSAARERVKRGECSSVVKSSNYVQITKAVNVRHTAMNSSPSTWRNSSLHPVFLFWAVRLSQRRVSRIFFPSPPTSIFFLLLVTSAFASCLTQLARTQILRLTSSTSALSLATGYCNPTSLPLSLVLMPFLPVYLTPSPSSHDC